MHVAYRPIGLRDIGDAVAYDECSHPQILSSRSSRPIDDNAERERRTLVDEQPTWIRIITYLSDIMGNQRLTFFTT